MSLTIFRKCFHDMGVSFVAICLQCVENHTQTTVWHDGSLEGRLSLQAEDQFIWLIDIARTMGSYATRDLRNVENAFFPLLDKQLVKPRPYFCCSLCCGSEE